MAAGSLYENACTSSESKVRKQTDADSGSGVPGVSKCEFDQGAVGATTQRFGRLRNGVLTCEQGSTA